MKCKETIKGTYLWYTIINQKGYTKITANVKQAMYYWNIQNPQVVQSKIANYCIKVFIDGPSIKQVLPKMSFQVSVKKYTTWWWFQEKKVVRNTCKKENTNVITNNSILWYTLPPLTSSMYENHRVICGCECCIYATCLHLYF